ncbi:MAG: glycosyltransferase [Planctomycetes bacterium]|nr:glycosyltransferase [Planctomycetota bacterium]
MEIESVVTRGSERELLEGNPRPRAAATRGITLIVPALNEEDAIAETVHGARRILEARGHDVEILVVDDGSADRTAEIAAESGAAVLRHVYRRGYGSALRTGILHARNETIAICDADGTYPLDALPRLLDEYERGYDLVIGARTGRYFRGGWIKMPARKLFHRMCESATGTRLTDVNSGLRIFRRSTILPYLAMMCAGFSFTTSQTLCFLSLNRVVGWVPVDYHNRIGKSKVRHFVDSLRTAQYIVQMYTIFNPVKLFTLLAFLPFLGGIALLAGQVLASAAGGGAPWSSIWLPVTFCFGVSALLFAGGLAVYGIVRQSLPHSDAAAPPAAPRKRAAR